MDQCWKAAFRASKRIGFKGVLQIRRTNLNGLLMQATGLLLGLIVSEKETKTSL